MTIQPSRKAFISTLIVTSVIWGPALAEIFLNPFDIAGWLILSIAALIFSYVMTQKIVVEDGKVRAFRYFLLKAEADAHSAKLVPAQVGNPPVLPGFAVIAADKQTVVELVPWNFAAHDIERLRTALSK